MNKEDLKKKLIGEGFAHIYEWRDAPGTEYPMHSHKGRVCIYIVEGGVTFWFESETITLKQGDSFEVPIGKEHTAKVGPTGCLFLVGEMIKGDS